jgi:hypothetical protein
MLGFRHRVRSLKTGLLEKGSPLGCPRSGCQQQPAARECAPAARAAEGRLRRPAHARSTPWRRDLRADPVDLLPAMQPERAICEARNADDGAVVIVVGTEK